MKRLFRSIFVLIFSIDCILCISLGNFSVENAADQCLDENYNEKAVWGPILEEWATGGHRNRRVLKFSSPMPMELSIESSPNIIEVPPPKNLNKSFESEENNFRESKISTLSPNKYPAPTKIVNNGPPLMSNPSGINGNKKPPVRQVTETDLYLLGAIEKVVFRLDTMEKRLRKVEEMMYFVTAGNRIDIEPCNDNFTRIGHNCYYFGSTAGRELDWKAANKICLKHRSHLVEFENHQENEEVVAYIQSNSILRGKDFWTGGLNPGLLWIWSGTAQPVITQNKNQKPNTYVTGDGRCLRLAYDASLRKYIYRGTDCSVRYGYICELTDNSSSNQIRRLGRLKNIFSD